MAIQGRTSSIIALIGSMTVLFLLALWIMLKTEYTPTKHLIDLGGKVRVHIEAKSVRVWIDTLKEGRALMIRYVAGNNTPFGGTPKTELDRVANFALDQYAGDRSEFTLIHVERVRQIQGSCRTLESSEEVLYSAPPPPPKPVKVPATR